MIALSWGISFYLGRSYISHEMNYVSNALDESANFMDENMQLTKKLIYNVYTECCNDKNLYAFMLKNSDPDIEAANRRAFYSYIKNILANNRNLQSITYYRSADGEAFNYYYNGTTQNNFTSTQSAPEAILDQMGKGYVISKDSDYGYSVTFPFNNIKTFMPIGYISFEFANSGIDNVFVKYTKEIECNFLLTSGSTLIYILNSEDNAITSMYKDFSIPKTSNAFISSTYGGMQYYILGKEDKNLGVSEYCVIKRSETERYFQPIRTTVFIATILVGMLFTLILYLGNRGFSSRINLLLKQISRIRNGAPLEVIDQVNKPDELGIIYAHFNEMYKELQEYIQKTYLFELKKKSAEYKLLQMQINPHFLFNTLEVIRMKAAIEGYSEASQMIYNLAILMQQTTKQDYVCTLDDEINYCRCYLDLFTPQFKNGLVYEIHLSFECKYCGIIRHTLQPLLENSIVHAFQEEKPINHLAISIYKQGDNLIIDIIDNGAGMDDSLCEELNAAMISDMDERDNTSDNIGLRNVNDRIRLVYGNAYGIRIINSSKDGTTIRVHLQYLSCEEVFRLVQASYC